MLLEAKPQKSSREEKVNRDIETVPGLSRFFEKSVQYESNEGEIFQVIHAKDMNKNAWNEEILHSAVLKARESYKVYGDVPLEDEYDRISTVCLVRAVYKLPENEKETEEYLCMRFIPGNEGISHMEYNGSPMEEKIKERLLPTSKDFREIVTLSKISRISPMKDISVTGQEGMSHSGVQSRLRHGSIAFAIANDEFFSHENSFKYVFGLFRDELVKRLTTTDDKKIIPSFIKARQTLELGETDILRVKKEEAILFPSYFFYTKDILHLLEKYLGEKILKEETLDNYFFPKTFREVVKNPHFATEEVGRLGRLFSIKGKIPGSTLTGEELRGKVMELPCAPSAYITEVSRWKESIKRFLEIKGISKAVLN